MIREAKTRCLYPVLGLQLPLDSAIAVSYSATYHRFAR